MWLAFLLLVVALWSLQRLLTDVYDYWKAKGIPHMRGRFPYGSMAELLTYRRYLGHVHQKVYRLLGDHPYAGVYVGRTPVLLVKDPGVIGRVLVSDFAYFRDRDKTSEGSSDVVARNLLRVTGDTWRALRSKMTPTFSSSKLRRMYAHLEYCAERLDLVLRENAGRRAVVDVKDLMTDFTLDVVCTCAFGLDVRSINKAGNELRAIGKSLFSPGLPPPKRLTLMYGTMFPAIRKLFKTNAYPPRVSEVVTRIVNESVEYREKNRVTRNDFLDSLIELKNSKDNDKQSGEDGSKLSLEMTMDLLVAQCFVFLVAGLETSSSVISFCLYELALNPGIQDRLRAEIDDVSKREGLSYDSIKNMSYLDQVVSETMRKYPTFQYLNRTCTKPYKMPETDFVIDKDTLLLIPVYALHHDPAYFPNPEVFDPDRFSQGRRTSFPPFSYLPFGDGPRNCIGLRLGKLKTKLGICTVLSKYKVETAAETQIPLELAPTYMLTCTKGAINLKIINKNEE